MERMTSTSAALADRARGLLLEHVDRTVTGLLEDPAVVAAVVGVERLVVATGSTDPATLRGALDPAGHPDADVAEVVAEALASVAAGLERRDGGEPVDAGVVNPDAGRHEIVADAQLLRAGVRASQRSYDATPYYRLRYGGRGARFASTDTAWLISLADLENYHAKIRKPLDETYHFGGHTWQVITSPPPSSGGVAIIETLNILRTLPLKPVPAVCVLGRRPA